MLCLKAWGSGLRSSVTMFGPIPAKAYLRFLQRRFWDVEHRRFGHAALRLDLDLITTIEDLSRDTTKAEEAHFGELAVRWMSRASRRLRDHDEDQRVLWQYLLNRKVEACEPQMANGVWYIERTTWRKTDYHHCAFFLSLQRTHVSLLQAGNASASLAPCQRVAYERLH